MVRRILNKLYKIYYQSNGERYIKYLRTRGIQIGGGVHINPRKSHIDITRPSLVSIGSNCYLNDGFTLLTHDWVTKVFINSGREFLPSSGRVTIGDNVSFGQNVMVLKGVHIGNNSFIGAGSIVTKDIPANSIAVGVPCRVIMSLEDYYQKRRQKCVDEAFEYARSIQERFNRRPVASDFWEEFPLFVSGENIGQYPEISEIILRQCGPSYENYVKYHKAPFASLDEFLEASKL